MEDSKKVLNLVAGALAGVLVAVAVIWSVTFSVNMVLTPLVTGLKDVGQLTARLAALEADIKDLKQGVQNKQGPSRPPEDLNKVYDLPVADSFVLGKADAKVTITAFSDIQCPYCAQYHGVINDVLKAFPDDVKFIFKHYPLSFHEKARPAAKAAMAAGLQGKFYPMMDALMARNPDNVTEADFRAFAKGKGLDPDKYIEDLKKAWSSRNEGDKNPPKLEMPPRRPEFSAEVYRQVAGELGLNLEQFDKDLKEKDAEFEKKIEADILLGGQADVRGTPTYFLNGKKVRARDIQAWTEAIQAVLKK
jgi:protein-disulfide isomerase